MNVGITFFVGLVALVVLGGSAAMIVGGYHLYRRPSRVPRVAVRAVVVHFQNFQRAPDVTFDYPAPDGSWIRTTRKAGLVDVQRQGHGVQPGDTLTVHVDPTRPTDVSLGPGGDAGSFLGIALMIAGGLLALTGTTFVLNVLGASL